MAVYSLLSLVVVVVGISLQTQTNPLTRTSLNEKNIPVINDDDGDDDVDDRSQSLNVIMPVNATGIHSHSEA